MYQPEDNFDSELPDQDNKINSDKNIDHINANLSPKNVAIRKKQLEIFFVKLIIFGLALGAVLGVGTYYLLGKLGLTKKPYQIEQERQHQEKATPLEEIQYFSPAPKSFTLNE